MKVYPYFNESGNLISFEVPNWKVSRNRAARITASVEGVEVTKAPKKLFSWSREVVFCEFKIRQHSYEIEEPFGDNSRYLISSAGKPAFGLEIVLEAFKAAW